MTTKDKASKPKRLVMQRHADWQTHIEAAAECDRWEVSLDGNGRKYECGRTVRVPALCFDEHGAKAMRRLAAWLEQAAAWAESGEPAAKPRR